MQLTVLDNPLAIYRFHSDADFDWLSTLRQQTFYSITQTVDELSIVCQADTVFPIQPQSAESGWHALKVVGPLDFSLTGILNSLTMPLADAKISIFAISTFDTDYLLVKSEQLENAKHVLSKASHSWL